MNKVWLIPLFVVVIAILLGIALWLVLPKKAALIYISGEITDERARGILHALESAEKDPGVCGILLIVNSPGGEFAPSYEIYEAVKLSEKPVVAYLEDLATSGAYLAVSPADWIISSPGTITGSIGVIAVFPNIAGLLRKLGIEVETLKSGKLKDMGSIFKELSPEERRIWQEVLDELHEKFISLVLEARERINRRQFLAIADGRILSPEQALKIGMIDEIGGLEDARKKLAEYCGSNFEFEIFPVFTPEEPLLALRLEVPSLGLRAE